MQAASCLSSRAAQSIRAHPRTSKSASVSIDDAILNLLLSEFFSVVLIRLNSFIYSINLILGLIQI